MFRCTGSNELLTFGFVAGASRAALTSMGKNRKTLGMQLSLVGRYVRDVEAGGSNSLNPTRVWSLTSRSFPMVYFSEYEPVWRLQA